MAHYVNSIPSLSTFGCCEIAGRNSICLSLAVVGFICLAAALTLALRVDRKVPVRIRIDE